MSLLNTAILAGLFAALLPFIIHFFTRSKSKPVRFSSLAFLKELEVKNIRRLKIRQVLLLLIRTLIILLLVFTFARPALKRSRLNAVPDAATTSVIVLDNSYSMQCRESDTSLLQRAKEKALEVVDTHHIGDKIYYIIATDTSENISRAYQDIDALKERIEKTEIAFQGAQMPTALDRAAALLKKSNDINKELYVISDFQKHNFLSDSGSVSDQMIAIPVYPQRVDNLCVKQIKILSTIFQTGKVIRLQALVANTGTRVAENRLVQLFFNGSRVAQSAVSLEPGEQTSILFRFILEKRGYQSGSVVLEDDELLADNNKYFTFYTPDGIQIGLEDSHPYIETALRPTKREPSPFKIHQLPASDYVNPDRYDVLVLAHFSRLDDSFCGKLADFVQSGNGLFLVLGQNIDIKNFNQHVANHLQLPPILESIGSSENRESIFSAGRADLAHPVFDGIFTTEEKDIGDPVFHFALKFRPTPEIDPIIEYNTGELFMFERRLGEGTIILCTTGFDPAITDFIYKPLFAPLIFRTIGYLGVQSQIGREQLTVGDPLQYKLSAAHVHQDLVMHRPDRRMDSVYPVLTASGTWIQYPQTDVPGVYSLFADDEILGQWSLNIDTAESDLSRISEEKIKERYTMNIVFADISAFINKLRFGRELWPFLLAAALLLLFIEMLIYKEKGETSVQKES